MYPAVVAIEHHFPASSLSNADLTAQFPQWTPDKVKAKTGIDSRYIAGADEFASDLATACGAKLLARQICPVDEIDFLIVVTQSPDYLLPSTACLVQERLGLPTSIGAFDLNLGCSGFVYALSVAAGMISSGTARNVLLITVETYSKYMDHEDFSVRALFGDGAAATLIQGQSQPPEGPDRWIGPFAFGTDGKGAQAFNLHRGGVRQLAAAESAAAEATDNSRTLFMNGPEMFTFTLRVVPEIVANALQRADMTLDQVDAFVFHQANQFMLEHLRNKLGIPQDRFIVAMDDCGNTTSSSIPIALNRASADGRIKAGDRIMLVGFGVGFSWAAGMLCWQPDVNARGAGS